MQWFVCTQQENVSTISKEASQVNTSQTLKNSLLVLRQILLMDCYQSGRKC